jgi:hypothetical protein
MSLMHAAANVTHMLLLLLLLLLLQGFCVR